MALYELTNLLSIDDLTNEQILNLIKRAIDIKENNNQIKRDDLYVANLFFENSTRTKMSFVVAQNKLGLKSIDFEVSTSSVNKGETLYDTCKTLEMIGVNMLVIRHSQKQYYKELENLEIPIINGGDGSGEHPTQCLLDLMTIYEKFKSFEGLKIAIVGDIKNSRVAKSNYKALTKLGAIVHFVAPDKFKDDEFNNYKEFDEIINEIDVCMLLRVQHERHESQDKTQEFINIYHQQHGLSLPRYNKLKENAIVMHPAPVNRGVEIDTTLVESDKSVIFLQMKNGMFMRQAVLEYIIAENNL
ncbi:aspartate carbamoyltransferase catalytic subunit [Malacoplasma penetrans]|uniref:Aspartate carbamoyltransferase catalytic subunit n=1 Tax=Malacoplasma penetrans (strain HF-2) TaxID=272633 RepID=PYRB_MALP2|nr:aspartate carbamoyltransferase catalytic subunit [Malacoplasma penetrans]Q8EUX9.1 RecName: Full=Aspartate carbamoyltransferase catalytic subunit; AltName: Full=Aspartate transcarbamylase; Short=ATCase [Malacoplasma penetrans HF-2]RXY96152.1 aspartate carbamoyltransferase catalytic subunit [Malacoplasma penetrans]BAC44582.1 aspartate carbamoyltransferase [Malacoplasma penetrans HF-2]